MNYGKKGIENHKKEIKSRSSRTRKKLILTIFKTIFVGILLIVAVTFGAVGIYVSNLIAACPDISEIDISPTGFSTSILDNKGKEIETLAASGANREYVTLDQVPIDLQHAFVAIEDVRFYEHNGIDLKGIMRAAITGITERDFSQGASTITQQLLKNNYFTGWTDENTFLDRLNRKIQEQYLAIELEKVTTKDEIMEKYLNTINLGQNTLGVEAASERYFNKTVSDLNLSECAVIAGITQNPSRYNPISNPDENEKRRSKTLKNMLDQGYISKNDYKKALADDVYSRIQNVNTEIATTTTTYFVDALTDQVMDDLIEEKGYTETQAYNQLYRGGLTIKSTQDTAIQKIVDEEVNNLENYRNDPQVSFTYRLTITKADGTFENYSEQTMLSYYQSKNKSYNINFPSEEAAAKAIEDYKAEIMDEGDTIGEAGESVIYTMQPQVAITVMDQSSGNVIALCGGRGDKTASKTLNRATGITRQPGSTFKVLAAFAPALDAGGLTLASVQDDAPTTYSNGTPLSNYDDTYRGYTNIRQATINSINVVAVKTLTQIGTSLGFEYVEDFGITTLESSDNNQALALGGITRGVTNLELCGAYATIANEGKYNKPCLYTQVLDNDGNVILDNTENKPRQVLKDTTAWLMTQAMKDVMTEGTGKNAAFAGMPIAGKSGTTTKDRDTVFAGYSPYYTCTVWGGYDDNAPQNYTQYSKYLWRAVMSRLHEGKAVKDFKQPEGIVKVTVCRKSGLLPIENVCDCDPRGSMLMTEFFAKGTEPTTTCDHHRSVIICNETGVPASPYCQNRSYGIFIIGAQAGGADGPYSLSEELLTHTCTLHTANGIASNWQPEYTTPYTQDFSIQTTTYPDGHTDVQIVDAEGRVSGTSVDSQAGATTTENGDIIQVDGGNGGTTSAPGSTNHGTTNQTTNQGTNNQTTTNQGTNNQTTTNQGTNNQTTTNQNNSTQVYE